MSDNPSRQSQGAQDFSISRTFDQLDAYLAHA